MSLTVCHKQQCTSNIKNGHVLHLFLFAVCEVSEDGTVYWNLLMQILSHFLFEIRFTRLSAVRIGQPAVNWAFRCCINRNNKLSFQACWTVDVSQVSYHMSDTIRNLVLIGAVELIMRDLLAACKIKITTITTTKYVPCWTHWFQIVSYFYCK